MIRTLRQVLDSKGHDIWSIAPDASVFEAIRLMAEKGIGLLVVLEQGSSAGPRGMPVGVISERDYARKVILEGKSSRETAVADIMTRQVVCSRPDQTVQEALSIMTENRFRHLPVVDGQSLVGIVSIGDLVKAVIADQQFRIEQLEGYISS